MGMILTLGFAYTSSWFGTTKAAVQAVGAVT